MSNNPGEHQDSIGKKKILVVGLNNSGETSIILSMKGEHSLPAYIDIKSTPQLAIDKVESGLETFVMWEQGGQQVYRNAMLETFEQRIAPNVHKIIFVIDVQAQNRYNEALDYLNSILMKFLNEKKYPPLVVFLHKFDPELEKNRNFSSDLLDQLLKKLTGLVPAFFKLEIYKSAIQTVFRKTPLTLI